MLAGGGSNQGRRLYRSSLGLAVLAVLMIRPVVAETNPACAIAVTGATVIDGNGGVPLRNATVLVREGRFVAIGAGAQVQVPNCAKRINARGKFIVPGFIDTNVHVAMPTQPVDYARYFERLSDLAVEGAQMHLKYGVTSMRDSYGVLRPLLDARDRINCGETAGARLFVAGNIVGWGGNFSRSFRGRGPEDWYEAWANEQVTHGVGELLSWQSPEEIAKAVDRYIDLGVDFVKIGVTDHDHNWPALMFSERQLNAIVRAVHARGKVAEAHATSPEGMVMAMNAGVDLIQHPEVIGVPITDEVLAMLDARKAICSLHTNNHGGRAWQEVLAAQARKQADAKASAGESASQLRQWREPSITDKARQDKQLADNSQVFRDNAIKIMATDCIITTATDNSMGRPPELVEKPNQWRAREPGLGTLAAVEVLVELGMSPIQAITAGTRNGAIALHMQDQLGTVEAGKIADMVILDADPLRDIGNIRRIHMVMKDGGIIDRERLPDNPVYYRPQEQ
ncbi:MAG: amidohydrolase family protein [Pseudomonadota bacterium]|nr:amidohydrolase family protein [Pseudomonadota bacterium]